MEEKNKAILQGESEGSSSSVLQDSSRYDEDTRNDFWSISGNFISCHHVESRVKLNVSRVQSFPVPLKYIDVISATKRSLDIMLEKNVDDYWNVDGDRELSDTWTECTRFSVANENPRMDLYGP